MSGPSKRPRSLHEVSARVASGAQGFDAAVREFLDVFYLHPDARTQALAQCPLPLDDIKDAYLSAVAEHLARSYAIDAPAWPDTHGPPLRRPFFAGGLESLKAMLTVQSPTAFRRRLLFVSHDALDPPRRRTSGDGSEMEIQAAPPSEKPRSP